MARRPERLLDRAALCVLVAVFPVDGCWRPLVRLWDEKQGNPNKATRKLPRLVNYRDSQIIETRRSQRRGDFRRGTLCPLRPLFFHSSQSVPAVSRYSTSPRFPSRLRSNEDGLRSTSASQFVPPKSSSSLLLDCSTASVRVITLAYAGPTVRLALLFPRLDRFDRLLELDRLDNSQPSRCRIACV